jgi:hypothetical protein
MMRVYMAAMEGSSKLESELYSLEFEIFVLNENNELTELSELTDYSAYSKLKGLMISFFKESFPYHYHEKNIERYTSFDNNIKYSLNYDDEDKQLDLTIENLTVWEEYKRKKDNLDGIKKDTVKSNPFR